MSDLIRRSDAIKALNREKSDWNCDYNVPIDNCIKRLNKVKSADRPQEWIPCSERLPSENDEFLITWTASVTNGPLLAFAEYEPDDFLVSGGKWYLEDDMREFKDVDVIAWIPLPKPYGEREGE